MTVLEKFMLYVKNKKKRRNIPVKKYTGKQRKHEISRPSLTMYHYCITNPWFCMSVISNRVCVSMTSLFEE